MDFPPPPLNGWLILPSRPIHGLIFLFRWIEEQGADDEDQVEDGEEEKENYATSKLWFANQVS